MVNALSAISRCARACAKPAATSGPIDFLRTIKQTKPTVYSALKREINTSGATGATDLLRMFLKKEKASNWQQFVQEGITKMGLKPEVTNEGLLKSMKYFA